MHLLSHVLNLYSVVDVLEHRVPKLQELKLPTGTVFVCILKNIPGRKIKMFFSNLVFFQGTRRNKQPFEPDS